MVLRAQTDFVEFLEQVLEVLKEVEIDKTECYTLLESVQKQQLVIPVVGNFSAGKSTLLNRFLEKSVFSTGITPETSLATELHYSVDERIEAFSNNDEKAESFELNEQSFEVIKENATKYSYLKVYLNNEALKTALPLVFVDMPGFDSPISSHTHAILEYLERGTHFVILTSVEEGSLTKSMVRELKNLLEFDYTDLLPSEIKEQTGLLEGDEANQFIQSTESYMRGFKETIKNDVKDYIKVLKENLKDQNFADDVLSKLVEETQNLKNQVRNREKVLAQIDAQIKALGEI
ncbi:hypothetical protein HpRN133_11150 [Helicobacter pylori]